MDINSAVPKPRFAVLNCAAFKVTSSALRVSAPFAATTDSAGLFPAQARLIY